MNSQKKREIFMVKLSCEACTLHKTCQHPCINGRGSLKSSIVLLGEAPGENEDKQGTPFIGAAGGFLTKHILRGSGLSESDLYITNAIKCRPPANRKPSILNIRACEPNLIKELQTIKPKVILACGNTALHSLLNLYHSKSTNDEKKSSGLTGISQWRGIQVWNRQFNCWVVPTYHPSALLRDRQEGIEYRIDQTVEDFELAGKLANQTRPAMEYPTPYHISSVSKALKVVEGVSKSKRVAFDIETEDLDPTSELLGISLSDREDRGFYIQADLIQQSPELRSAIDELMEDPDILKILHNGAFDQRVLRYKGFPELRNWKDIMIAAGLLDENFPKGLKPLTWRYLSFGGYDRELDDYRREHKLKSYKGIPFDVLGRYAGYDAAATLQLHNLFSPRLDNEKLQSLYTNILMPTRSVMNEAEHNGFAVNVDRAKELDALCNKAAVKLREHVYKLAGEEFNIRSPKQLSNILYTKLHLRPLKPGKINKKDGSIAYSCDKESLEHLAKKKKGEIAGALLNIKYIQSMQSKFINLIINEVKPDGRIHTSYNITGTVTGRTSCSNPGIHNVPRDRLIRSMFVASQGRALVEADVKSAELRCLAVYSQEKFLLDAFNSNQDPHRMTYNLMYGKPSDYTPTEGERFIAKSINFGLVYGMGPGRLARILGISLEEAINLVDLYFEKMPNVKKFLTDNIKKAHKVGYVVSVFGRKRRLPLINSDDNMVISRSERQANNSVIQSASADFTYVILTRVSKMIRSRKLKAKIVHTVHDCIIVDTPKNEIEMVKKIIHQAFEAPVNVLPIKMEMDVDVVSCWGENKESRLEQVLVDMGIIKRSKQRVKEDDETNPFEGEEEEIA
jgi:DNA polymerase-1